MDGVAEMRTEGIYQKRAALIWLHQRVNRSRRELGLPSLAQENFRRMSLATHQMRENLREAGEAAAQMGRSLTLALAPIELSKGAQIEDSHE